MRLVDDKMHTQSAHSALVDICRIAKCLFISYTLTEWYILFLLWVHQAVIKIGNICSVYSLTFPTFTFRMVLKYVQNVPKVIMIMTRKKRINVLVTKRRVWKIMLPVHGQTRRRYSF